MLETSSIQNNFNDFGQGQVRTILSPSNIDNKIGKRSHKLLVKKIVLAILLLIFCSPIIGLYLFNKFVYPVVTFLPQPLKPWSRTEGTICDFGNCRISEVNQIYNYWLSEAQKKQNPNLCNNTVGFDGGDVGISSKEYSVNQCKVEYSKKTGDVELCNSLPAESGVQCLIGIAEAFSKPELLKANICIDLKDNGKVGKCLALISLKTNTYTCNQLDNKEIKKVCDSELLMFHEESIHRLQGLEAIKKTSKIKIPIGGNIWGTSTTVTKINNDGSIALWLNGTLYSCSPEEDVFLRSDGPVCTPEVPIYYITRCSLEGNNVALDYFVYDTDCHW